ncbi:ATPase, partial [Salmonella enterica subsp. enterica]|nr:ATPase [Salmonella enterica subsp. enterica]
VVLCGAEFPFVQDGTRQGEVFRARQQVWYEQELSRRNIPYLSVSGPLQERVEQILRQLPD